MMHVASTQGWVVTMISIERGVVMVLTKRGVVMISMEGGVTKGFLMMQGCVTGGEMVMILVIMTIWDWGVTTRRQVMYQVWQRRWTWV